MNREQRIEFNEYMLDLEEHEKYFESEFEHFCYNLTDKELDYLLDCRSRAADMAKELK